MTDENPPQEGNQHALSPTNDIQVMARSAAILRVLAETPGAGPVEVAKQLGLTRTTTHRYFVSLARHGFLQRKSKESYALGPLLLHLGVAALRSAPVADVAAGPMTRLAREVEQTVALAIWAGEFPVVIRMEDFVQNLPSVTVRVGGQLSIDSSHAKIFLAFMSDAANRLRVLDSMDAKMRNQYLSEEEQIRSEGLAFRDNSWRGVRAVSAPVFEYPRNICASLAIIGREASMPEDADSEMYGLLRQAADEISHLMGVS